ncbi:MAG TPA: hypothetical protein VN814_04725 [Caulobacteraceae bacterium]|nr:hypothetical protein [Caulobacteraceae bacterium]
MAASSVLLLVSPQTVAAPSGPDMPAGCEQNPARCSLEIWPPNSFPHTGAQWSVTFSNGATLDCTSNGHNVPRSCTLTGLSSPAQPETLAEQCAKLKAGLRTMQSHASGVRDIDQADVDRERDYLARALQMTPAQLNAEILRQQQRSSNQAELYFLVKLQGSRLLGHELGGASQEQMQAQAKQLVDDMQQTADEKREYNKEIDEAERQIKSLDCDNVPSLNQSVGAP